MTALSKVLIVELTTSAVHRILRIRHRLLAGVAITTLVVLATTGAAGAHRAPTRSEAKQISQALHKSSATGVVHCFHLRGVVVSTVGPWARATVVRCGDGRRFDTALTVLQRRHGHWHVRDLGTADVGCSVTPTRVRRDLRLICA